ncbi:MAG: hypothetical protein U1E51_00395, partial [Candidatus Binatia bacterium]|nr:hypothetical protein [Candidatus Binatia bacterium]
MHDHKNIWFAVVFGLVFWLSLSSAMAQIALTPEQAKTMVSVHDVKVDETGISGELANSSPHPIRDIDLLLKYIWRWHDEFHPADNAPGNVAVVTLKEQLAPGQTLYFAYAGPVPEANRAHGRFETEVSVAGFTV